MSSDVQYEGTAKQAWAITGDGESIDYKLGEYYIPYVIPGITAVERSLLQCTYRNVIAHTAPTCSVHSEVSV